MIGKGCVIAIGGNEEKRGTRASILSAFVRRAGGADARIVIIPSASVEPMRRGEMYERLFTRFGAGAVRVVHVHKGVSGEEREAIRTSTGIFITGGDQLRLMDFLRAADCVNLIRETVRSGAVYAGTSAGASAASMLMIAGDNGEYAAGLGLLPDVIIDQHFSERARLPRLKKISREHRLTGIGIDENTAVVWQPDGMTVEGSGEVTVVDENGRQLLVRR
jgi:cyanophycinase